MNRELANSNVPVNDIHRTTKRIGAFQESLSSFQRLIALNSLVLAISFGLIAGLTTSVSFAQDDPPSSSGKLVELPPPPPLKVPASELVVPQASTPEISTPKVPSPQVIEDIEAIRKQLGGGVAGQLKGLTDANPKLKASGEADFKAALNRLAKEGQGKSPPVGQNGAGTRPITNMERVLVAAESLDIRTPLTAENVKVENWPARIIPEDAVSSFDEVVGKVVVTRTYKGMPLVKANIAYEKDLTCVNIPQGFKVVAVKVSGDDTLSGLLMRGDKVDLIGIFKMRNQSGEYETRSLTFGKNINVFSVIGRESDDRLATVGSGSCIVGLLVNEEQAEDIYFARTKGELKLVLRGDEAMDDGKQESLDGVKKWLSSGDAKFLNLGPERRIEAQQQLRNAARQMESVAADFESTGLYEEADQMRAKATEFWRKARAINSNQKER